MQSNPNFPEANAEETIPKYMPTIDVDEMRGGAGAPEHRVTIQLDHFFGPENGPNSSQKPEKNVIWNECMYKPILVVWVAFWTMSFDFLPSMAVAQGRGRVLLPVCGCAFRTRLAWCAWPAVDYKKQLKEIHISYARSFADNRAQSILEFRTFIPSVQPKQRGTYSIKSRYCHGFR